MRIVKPITVDDSILTSTTIPADTTQEWVITTPYVAGDIVRIESSHTLYECLLDNTGEDPSQNTVDGNGNPYWLNLGATNRWAMFDGKSRKSSTNPDLIDVTLQPNKVVNSISLLNISAGSVQVIMTDPVDGIVYDELVNTLELVPSDFYEWCFTEVTLISNIVKIDLPAYPSASIRVIASSPNATVRIGELIIGVQEELGVTTYGTSVGIIDYSRKDTDAFGNPIIVERPFIDSVSYQVAIPTNRVSQVKNTLSSYRATPVVYIGDQNFPSTIVYGFIKTFGINIAYPNLSEMSIEVEELI